MTELKFDFTNICGKIKPMNAVNNGPAGSKERETGAFAEYADLEVPYARYHDSAYYSGYGGEHTVDVHRIFKKFDADENDPQSYVFGPTDEYVKNTLDVGTRPYYRLGASIEHGYKFGTYPPKDFHKWARICEHIIRHYTEGWADGFNYDIEYWEIWNEPDCKNADGSNPCWQGSFEQFIDLYEIAAKHLKSTFPHLKIGGPAFTSPRKMDEIVPFLNAVKERSIPLDFYSFHGYANTPRRVKEASDTAMRTLIEAGLVGENGERPELHYNEWNYVKAWAGDLYKYSRKAAKRLKGASFVAGCMCVGQQSDIDMMMYYDARPCSWCGLFDTDTLDLLKPYYSFLMFKELPRLGNWVKADAAVDNVYSIAATDGKSGAVLLTYYVDEDEAPAEQVKVDFTGVKSENGVRVEYYLLDDEHNANLVRSDVFISENFSACLDMKLFDTCLLKIIPV